MTYSRKPYQGTNIESYVQRELDDVSAETSRLLPATVRFLSAEPKVEEGLIAGADGVVWDPGSGQGLYIYYGGSWHKLG